MLTSIDTNFYFCRAGSGGYDDGHMPPALQCVGNRMGMWGKQGMDTGDVWRGHGQHGGGAGLPFTSVTKSS